MEELTFVKSGNMGDKRFNLSNEIHNKLLFLLKDKEKDLATLAEELEMTELDVRRELNQLSKANVIKQERNKWQNDFIIIDNATVLEVSKIVDEYSTYLIPSIVNIINKNRLSLYTLDERLKDLNWNVILSLFSNIFLDIYFGEITEDFNAIYQKQRIYCKPWSISGYIGFEHGYINRMDIRSDLAENEYGMFIYGDYSLEDMKLMKAYGKFARISADNYASFSYFVYNEMGNISKKLLKDLIMFLETRIPSCLKNQLPYFVRNYSGFLRYDLRNYLFENDIMPAQKLQFIID